MLYNRDICCNGPYYLVPIFLRFHKMNAICDTFPNISSRVQDFRLYRELGKSLLHDKLHFYVFFRGAVALFTQGFFI